MNVVVSFSSLGMSLKLGSSCSLICLRQTYNHLFSYFGYHRSPWFLFQISIFWVRYLITILVLHNVKFYHFHLSKNLCSPNILFTWLTLFSFSSHRGDFWHKWRHLANVGLFLSCALFLALVLLSWHCQAERRRWVTLRVRARPEMIASAVLGRLLMHGLDVVGSFLLAGCAPHILELFITGVAIHQATAGRAIISVSLHHFVGGSDGWCGTVVLMLLHLKIN